MSVGRGTPYAFQQIGHPEYTDSSYFYIPKSNEGAKWPPHENQVCFGQLFAGQEPTYAFNLSYLMDMYQALPKDNFFNDYFIKLSGTPRLQKQIEAGRSEEEIRKTWVKDLNNFKKKRLKYLLYQ